jgi:S1-C subfamily serine protease
MRPTAGAVGTKRRPLYSRSGKPRAGGAAGLAGLPKVSAVYLDLPEDQRGPPLWQRLSGWWSRVYNKHQGKLLIATGAIVALLIVWAYDLSRPVIPRITDESFTAAVNEVVDKRKRPPSTAALAYAQIIPSVVMVQGYSKTKPKDDWMGKMRGAPWIQGGLDKYLTVGTGVVIDEDGDILTNFHVAGSEPRLHVTFADGTEAEGHMVGAQPEHDLAVIRTNVLPDDLQPATLAPSASLHPGDEVVAVGFPFGIGPSASSGVVSGLHRAFQDPDGKRTLTDLIQFDAAANPGNSGGPLVNADGEVVGIVTAILNPSGMRTFAGIGFAVPIETAAGAAGENPL